MKSSHAIPLNRELYIRHALQFILPFCRDKEQQKEKK